MKKVSEHDSIFTFVEIRVSVCRIYLKYKAAFYKINFVINFLCRIKRMQVL